MLDQQWDNICSYLKREVGLSAYKSWIAPLKLTSIEGSVAKFIVPTIFIGNWVSRNYGQKIYDAFKNEGISIDKLEFNTEKKTKLK